MLQLACSYVLVLLETPLKLVPPPGSLLQLLVHFIPVPVKTSFYMTCNLPSMMPSYPLVFSPWLARWNTGQPTDYKARCVAKGCSQIEGVDFNELFAAVAHRDTVWVFISLVDHLDLECDQVHIKAAFLNGNLEETIYLSPSEGSNIPADKVLLLRKSLYALQQSSQSVLEQRL
jgi:hypothetical protein